MKEFIKQLSSDIREAKTSSKELGEIALAFGFCVATLALGVIGTMPERKKINLALDQRDNSAQIMEMCGEDLEFCTIEYVDRCLQAVRDYGCVKSETLPIYTPINGN